MIQLVLLTGFLGAGKTTLMTSILEAYQDKKIGVIINEFGKINIDARLIEKDGIEMAELTNGSIFCACIKDKFVDSLIALSHTDIEYLFYRSIWARRPCEYAADSERNTAEDWNSVLLQRSALHCRRRKFSGPC